MIDGHALARPVGAPSPAGIDKPDLGPMRLNILAEELRVLARVQRQKRTAKTWAERRHGFGHPFFRARHFGRIAVDKMIHGLCRRQFGHWRQNTECITGQKYNILRLATAAGHGGVGDLGDRVGRPGIFGQRTVIKVDRTGRLVQHHIFQNRAEGPCGLVNLRLLFRRKFNHLGVTAALKVEDATFAPAVLIVPNQGARCIRRKRCLAGTGQPEENCGTAVITDISRGMHRQHALAGQQIIHDAEDGLLGLARVTGPADDDQFPGEIHNDKRR